MANKLQNFHFEQSRIKSPSVPFDENHQCHCSIDTNCFDDNERSCRIWTGDYEPVFEMEYKKMPELFLSRREPPLPIITNIVDVKTTKHFSNSSSNDITSVKEVGFRGHVTTNLYTRSQGDENDLHDKCWPLLDNSFPSRAKQIANEYRPQTSMDYYFRELDAGVNQLARWSVGLQQLTSVDPSEFKDTINNFRDKTGESPLRTWAVKLNAIIGLIRDIQYDMEAKNSSLD